MEQSAVPAVPEPAVPEPAPNRVRIVVDDWTHHYSTDPRKWGRTARTWHDTHRSMLVEVEGSDAAVAEIAHAAAAIARPRVDSWERNGIEWCKACDSRVLEGRCMNAMCAGGRAVLGR